MDATTLQEELMRHPSTKSLLASNKGTALLVMLMLILVVVLGGMETVFFHHLKQTKDSLRQGVKEGRIWLLQSMELAGSTDLSLRNSRFAINSYLRRCLTADPSPCDEREYYDLALFPAAPVVTYFGGPYPDAPTALQPLAGALTPDNGMPMVFYTASGRRCTEASLREPTLLCPLQGVARFKPLCGGDLTVPDVLAPGGAACAGPATGFEIHVGVGALINNNFVYKADSSSGGDTRVFRYSASELYN